MITGELKIKREVWATNSEKFGGYDYRAPDGTGWNVDRLENNIIYLWTINANGRTHYKQVNQFEFRQTWLPTRLG